MPVANPVIPPNPTRAWWLSHPVAQRRVGGGPFTPYVPLTSAPVGSYDPNLDAQRRAAQRGLGDLMADTALAGTRTTNDYLLAQEQLSEAEEQQLQDTRRQYDLLGSRQTQRARLAGVAEGGTPERSGQIRGRNMRRDVGRIESAFDLRQAELEQQYGRAGQDRALQEARARRELGFFEQDINAAGLWQAGQAGFLPGRPANEARSPGGQVYRTVTFNNRTYYVLPNGQMTTVRPR